MVYIPPIHNKYGADETIGGSIQSFFEISVLFTVFLLSSFVCIFGQIGYMGPLSSDL